MRFFIDYLPALAHSHIEHVVQVHHIAAARGKRAFLQRHHTVRHVEKIFIPFLSRKFQHLEPLPEVQVLLTCHHIKALIEVIRLFAIERRRKVARGVQSGAVRTHQKAGRHIVAKAYHFRAVVVHQQTFLRKQIEHGLHFIIVKALPGIRIERDVKAFIYLLHLFQSGSFEAVEYVQSFLVPVFYLLKPSASFVVQLGVFLRFLVKFDIYIHKRTHAALFYILVVAPKFVCHNEFAELRAPIAQMVYAHRVVARLFV